MLALTVSLPVIAEGANLLETVMIPSRPRRIREQVLALFLVLLGTAVAVAADRPDVIVADFEGDTYGGWTTEGEAFGGGPAHGTLPGQMAVTGFIGPRAGQLVREGGRVDRNDDLAAVPDRTALSQLLDRRGTTSGLVVYRPDGSGQGRANRHRAERPARRHRTTRLVGVGRSRPHGSDRHVANRRP